MRLRLNLLALGLCLCLILVAKAGAQLNFSTGWGKRSQGPPIVYQDAEAQAHHPSRLQSDLDLFIRYYRILKQIEAQQMANPSI